MNLKMMKRALFLSCLMMFAMACSRTAGKTSSTVKIVSGNFSSILSSKANNGLILYGVSADGKTFSKKIDTDTVDLVFPNGSWNFFAISWEVTTPTGTMPDFTGKTYCGRTSMALNGTDASIQINLTNAGCADPVFSQETKLYAGEYKFPTFDIFNCKNISGTLNTTACDQIAPSGYNKGYATSYRIVAYEAQNFGDAPAIKIAQSACVRTDFSTLTGLLSTSDASLIADAHIPTNFGNGLPLGIEIYYGEGSPGSKTACDGANGVDVVAPISVRSKPIVDTTPPVSIYHFYVQSNEVDTCSGARLTGGQFGGGFGTPGSPYAICTKGQMDLLRSAFSAYKTSSFDLLTDIDYGLSKVDPIGDVLSNTGTPSATNYFGGAGTRTVFDGRNHKISNFVIDCKTPSGTASNSQVGFFRMLGDVELKNITFNNGVIFCDDGNEIGVVTGRISNTIGAMITNVKVHGHSEGASQIGGFAGSIINNTVSIDGLHVKGIFDGKTKVGGLVGYLNLSSGANIAHSSFKGSIHADKGNGGAWVDSIAGGLIGAANTSSGSISIVQSIVKGDDIVGESVIGGFIGDATNVSISDSYSESVLTAKGQSDGSSTFVSIGGLVGRSASLTVNRVIVPNTVKYYPSKNIGDISVGGVLGNAVVDPTCTSSFYTGEHLSSASCGSSLSFASSKSQSSYVPMFSFPSLGGTWDAAASPSVSVLGSCNTPNNGKYFDIITANPSTSLGAALPGDIALCNGSSFSIIPMLSKASTLATYPWTMLDEGYDTPRLAFEASIEDSVTYLKRDCHGHYLTQAGSGTVADPKWICTYNQFTNMSADLSSTYILKKNIYYEGAAGGHTPLGAGAYKIEGNNFGLYNFTYTLPGSITSNSFYGIFQRLDAGAVINNLNIIAPGAYGASITTSGTPMIYVGLLAGQNSGLVNNIEIKAGKIQLDSMTAVAGDQLKLGGVFGGNAGTLRKSQIEVNNVIEDLVNFPAGSSMIAGGVVGMNTGTLEGVRGESSLDRRLECTGLALSYSDTETLGSFVGRNDTAGVLKEVMADGDFRSMPGSQSTQTTCIVNVSGKISSFVADNVGTITDFQVRPHMNFMAGSPAFLELFASNTGTVKRGIATFEPNDANRPINQVHIAGSPWDASTSPSAVTASSPTCSPPLAGTYYDISSTTASTASFGPVNNGDMIICNGSTNIYVPAAVKPYIMGASSMIEVLYLVQDSSPPTLAAGRYLDDALTYSIGSGLKVETSTPTTLFNSSGWSVATNFFSPGTSAWLLDMNNGVTTTTKPPELVKTGGSIDQLGIPF